MKMLIFIDKIFQLNLYGVAASYTASILGLVNLEEINTTREDLYQYALEISAYAAAIYGAYRVGKLIYDGISLMNKKIKERNERRKSNRRSK